MSPRPAARLVPVVGLALAAGLAPPAMTAAPVPTHLMKDPPLAFPTRIGTTWVYDEGGRETTYVIGAVEGKDGAKLVTTEYIRPDGTRTPHMTLSVSEQGVLMLAEHGLTYDPPWCVLKLPLRTGQKWAVSMSRQDEVRVTGTRTAGAWEKVKVPAGEFTAARVELEYPVRERDVKGRSTYWYAHEVGLVKLSYGDTLVLKSFTPGKD